MDQNHDSKTQMALDAAQRHAADMARVSETLSSTEFTDGSASAMAGFEALAAMTRTKNQAPLDIVAELKAINERLDAEQQARISAEAKAAKDTGKQRRIDKARFQYNQGSRPQTKG